MSTSWGRDESAGRWMPSGPRASLAAVALAAAAVATSAAYRNATLSPLQQHYLRAYTRSTVAAGLHLGPETYTLLTVSDRTGPRLATRADVANVQTPLHNTSGRYRNADVRDLLTATIYGGERLPRLFAAPLLLGVLVLVGLLALAVPKDLARSRERRQGRRLKGPELVDARTFRQRLAADGVALRQESGPALVIPREAEASHLLLAGDTGTGKSTLIAEILETVDARGETAVVYDPATDYVTKFYRPGRGDVILNPVDARCPYWKPGDEVLSDVEALTLATAMIPPRAYEANPFFPESARAIFGFLLTFRPTTQQLVAWLTNGDQLDQMVRGTVHEAILDHDAPAQRSGVMAALNLVADTLQLCPTEAESVGRWSAAEWARTRAGWVFITSTPETRARLVPLQTLWLDSIILRLMGTPLSRKAWLMVDELATLNRLPQLHTAVTEGRKSNLAMVIGFQGRSQLESRYGKDAETMLSQPATKIFLRASDSKSAEWASKTLGDVETERLKQSRQDGWARSATTSYGLERHVEPLVMPSEISGLANLRGYIKSGNLVSRLRFPYRARPAISPGLVQRRPVPTRALPVSPGTGLLACEPPVLEQPRSVPVLEL